MTIEDIIHKYDMEPHPEGGFYKRTYLSENASFSSILFLLTENNFSAFHKITSDEQWNWYAGDSILLHEIDKTGKYIKTYLSEEHQFQYVVKGGNWFASECIGKLGFALCGCTVIPAFTFEAFELGKRKELTKEYPEHISIIERLTKQ